MLCYNLENFRKGELYDLYLLIGIAKGIDDIKNGRGITLEEFDKEREALYESIT